MLVGSAVRRVAIVGGVRIPFARSYTAYSTASNQDMLTATLRAVVERFKLQGERLGDVAAGAVVKHSRDFKPVMPAVVEPRTGLSMGQSTEIMARQWQIPRADQDQLAYDSHMNAATAWRAGFYDDLVVEYQGLKIDNNIRGDTSLDRLGKLKPSFAPDGTLTAGNSTPLTDGASAVLLATPEWAARRKLPVLGFLRHGKVWAVDFATGK